MPEFEFKAIDAGGKAVSGVSSAYNQEDLAQVLHGQGIFLMECVQLPPKAGSADAALAKRARRLKLPVFHGRPAPKDIAFFTSQLAIMVRTSLPIMESLELLTVQTTNAAFKASLQDIERHVSEGMPISTAFERHPACFDKVYISLLAAGEASGKLDAMLARLASYLDFQLKLRQKVRSALLYPLIVIMTGILVVCFLVMFVLPTFKEIFAQLNVTLPLPTRLLFMLSDFLRAGWLLILGGAAAAWFSFRLWLRAPRNAVAFDRFVLRIPFLGELVRNIVLTRMLRTMGSLLDSGVSILRTLDLSKASADNHVFRELLENVTRSVREGNVLSRALAQSPHIPPAVIGMIATGERTGSLPEVIGRVSEFYEAQTDTAIKDLFTAMEPLFIVVLGVMVGGIAVSVLLPMFELARSIQ
jgi:type IV pilus assembly protein PilC